MCKPNNAQVIRLPLNLNLHYLSMPTLMPFSVIFSGFTKINASAVQTRDQRLPIKKLRKGRVPTIMDISFAVFVTNNVGTSLQV